MRVHTVFLAASFLWASAEAFGMYRAGGDDAVRPGGAPSALAVDAESNPKDWSLSTFQTLVFPTGRLVAFSGSDAEQDAQAAARMEQFEAFVAPGEHPDDLDRSHVSARGLTEAQKKRAVQTLVWRYIHRRLGATQHGSAPWWNGVWGPVVGHRQAKRLVSLVVESLSPVPDGGSVEQTLSDVIDVVFRTRVGPVTRLD